MNSPGAMVILLWIFNDACAIMLECFHLSSIEGCVCAFMAGLS
jgi:hypothetical protein